MGIFDFVLPGAWKPMSKSPGSGATWMLVLVVVATMFVTADSSWLLSEEEEASCLNGKTITGTCKDSSVDVESESNTIKATIKIKKGEKSFEGSITIGNCQIAGKFLGDQVFNVEATGAVNAPIEIVATTSEVTLQGKVANQKGSVCQSPFTLGKDGKAKTTIKLHVDTENIVSVELDSSVKVVRENHEKGGFKMPLWVWILLGLIVFAVIVIVIVFIYCCCYKKPKKVDPKASNANLENGNQQKIINAKAPIAPDGKLAKENKEIKDKKNEEKKNEKVQEVLKPNVELVVKPKDDKKMAENKDMNTAKEKLPNRVVNKEKVIADASLKYEKFDFPTGPYPIGYWHQLFRTFPLFDWSNYKLFDELVKFLLINPLNDEQYNAVVDEYKHWEGVVQEKKKKGKQEEPTKACMAMILLSAIMIVWNGCGQSKYEAKKGQLAAEDMMDKTQRPTKTDDTQDEVGQLMDEMERTFFLSPSDELIEAIKWVDVHRSFDKFCKNLMDCFDVTIICQYQLENDVRTLLEAYSLKRKEAEVLQKKLEALKRDYDDYVSVHSWILLLHFFR